MVRRAVPNVEQEKDKAALVLFKGLKGSWIDRTEKCGTTGTMKPVERQ